MKREVLALVGSTYDITGLMQGEVCLYDSNPGRTVTGCGGAGRNVGENMARMGLAVSMVTTVGTDAFSEQLLDSCKRAGIDVSRSFVRSGATACTYLSLLDARGELMLAEADLSLHESVSAEQYDALAPYIGSFPLVFVDTNNTEEQLKCIARACQGKLFADTVSIAKAIRLRPILSKLDTVKTNRGELEALSGLPADSTETLKNAMQSLLEKGVRRVFVTLGAEGCCYAEGETCVFLQGFPAKVVNVTGAGDAFAAAVVYGTVRGPRAEELLLLGTAASHIALESKTAIHGNMSEAFLWERYRKLEEQLKSEERTNEME